MGETDGNFVGKATRGGSDRAAFFSAKVAALTQAAEAKEKAAEALARGHYQEAEKLLEGPFEALKMLVTDLANPDYEIIKEIDALATMLQQLKIFQEGRDRW